MRKFILFLAAIAGLATASISNASSDFDVIVFGDANGNVHYHGTTYIGGSANQSGGNSSFGLDLGGYTGYSLVLGGNYGMQNDNVVHGKMLYGGEITPYTSLTSSDFEKDTSGKIAAYGITQADYIGMSDTYSNYAATGTISSIDNIVVGLTAGVNTQVFNISDDVFSAADNGGNTSFGFNINDNDDYIIINVTDTAGDGIAMGGGSNFNFLSNDIASRIIWNFYDTTSLSLKGFYGSVLAPEATLTLNNDVHGTVVVNSVTGNGQLHVTGGSFPDTPAVPAPSAVVLAAFGVISAGRRKFIR